MLEAGARLLPLPVFRSGRWVAGAWCVVRAHKRVICVKQTRRR
nr:MAG TPA: hypothetical protein [Caudoviricetes sp.]